MSKTEKTSEPKTGKPKRSSDNTPFRGSMKNRTESVYMYPSMRRLRPNRGKDKHSTMNLQVIRKVLMVGLNNRGTGGMPITIGGKAVWHDASVNV